MKRINQVKLINPRKIPIAINALINNDIHTVRDLVVLSESDLKELKGFGAKALDEVREKLTELKV